MCYKVGRKLASGIGKTLCLKINRKLKTLGLRLEKVNTSYTKPKMPQTYSTLKILPLVATCQQTTCPFHKVATNLIKSGLLKLTCNLQTCYLLKQLASSLWITSLKLTSCNKMCSSKSICAALKIFLCR